MLTGESRFHISTPQGIWTWVPCDGKQMGSPLDQWDMVWMQWDCRLSTGLSPSSRLRRLWIRKGDLQRAWNWDRKAMWDQVGLSHLSARGPSNASGQGLPQTRPQWSIMSGSPMKRGNANRRIPVSHKYPQGIWTQVPCDGKQVGSPLDQWDMV